MISQGKKVYVGMSGGVDSSVSAALLKEQGFNVTGVFIKVWSPDWMECTWKEDRLDAMRVAAKLDIPFKTIDLEAEYKKEVVDYMISEYKIGRTPNPDVMCNRFVKFGGFFDWAINDGADYVATGHYAQVREFPISNFQFPNSENQNLKPETYCMLSGLDQNKDQSYFLWTLTQRELSKTLFPVGGFEKSKVRELARKFELPTAEKKDSQGLCFIGKVDIEDFLSHYVDKKKGKVIDVDGNVIGEHDGALFFTLGKRHGFTITKKTSDDAPYYVIAKDLEKNTITVSHKSLEGHLSIEKKDIDIASTNWISSEPVLGKKYTARIRHLGDLEKCTLSMLGSMQARFVFDNPLIVASGQSVVVYDGEMCVGGGIVS
jgi:tRNA-specific 2-thiouridylase